MGLTADIELINGEDLVLARWNYIGEDEIKSMRVCKYAGGYRQHLYVA